MAASCMFRNRLTIRINFNFQTQGCGFNREYVWVGSDENDGCEMSADCISGSCVNGLCQNVPTDSPTLSPTTVFMSPTKSTSGSSGTNYYGYNLDESSKCNGDGATNWQGPAPFDDKSNTVVQFFAWGDAPYDSSCDICNTCIAEDGVTKESECTRFDCTVPNKDIESLPIQNTCTYEGYEYICVRDRLIPYMNAKMDGGDASFSVHVGDIIKGTTQNDGGISGNRRCTVSSFTSRRDLFEQLNNFLLVVGDNEWQDCIGYDMNSNSDDFRELWREYFAGATSAHHQFNRDFATSAGATRPKVTRMTSNPEIFHFEYSNTAYFGLNRGQGPQFITDISDVDFNAVWVEQQLALDTTCQLKSVVFISHTGPSSDVRNKLSEYFSRCSTLPTLSIKGNDHPSTYCLSMDIEHQLELTIEAARSGPVLVSIVEDPDSGVHFFHVDDPDKNDSNNACPELPIQTNSRISPSPEATHSQSKPSVETTMQPKPNGPGPLTFLAIGDVVSSA